MIVSQLPSQIYGEPGSQVRCWARRSSAAEHIGESSMHYCHYHLNGVARESGVGHNKAAKIASLASTQLHSCKHHQHYNCGYGMEAAANMANVTLTLLYFGLWVRLSGRLKLACYSNLEYF